MRKQVQALPLLTFVLTLAACGVSATVTWCEPVTDEEYDMLEDQR